MKSSPSVTTELFSHAATVLAAPSVMASRHFYRDQLGFEETFSWGDPVSYVVLRRGEVSIHLTEAERSVSDATCLYVFVRDVDAYHAEITARGLEAETPENREYGMRDFDLVDPGNNRITFGQNT